MLYAEPRSRSQKLPFWSERQAELTSALVVPVALSPIPAAPLLPDPLLPDEGSPQPSIAPPHQPASNALQSRGMAGGPPPVLPERSSVPGPKPASAASTPRSMSSPTAKRRKPSKSFPSPLLADRKHSSRARSPSSRPPCSERRSRASPGPQPPEYLKVGCVHARTPRRARIATPAESAEACLALPPLSAFAPEESARDFLPHTPSRHKAVPCGPVRSVPPRKYESDSDVPVRWLLSIE